MRNKIFLGVLILCFCVAAVGAPLHFYLMRAGVIEYDNNGNIIEPERVYEEGAALSGLFNGIEAAKRDIKDQYINHLPLGEDIILYARSLSQTLNQPVYDFWDREAVRIYFARIGAEGE